MWGLERVNFVRSRYVVLGDCYIWKYEFSVVRLLFIFLKEIWRFRFLCEFF